MSTRTEKFCDLIILEGEAKNPNKKFNGEPGDKCTNSANAKCFLCGRDYCNHHEGNIAKINLKLSGFKYELSHSIEVCRDCYDYEGLPFAVNEAVEKRFESLWRLVKSYLRKAKKEKKWKRPKK